MYSPGGVTWGPLARPPPGGRAFFPKHSGNPEETLLGHPTGMDRAPGGRRGEPGHRVWTPRGRPAHGRAAPPGRVQVVVDEDPGPAPGPHRRVLGDPFHRGQPADRGLPGPGRPGRRAGRAPAPSGPSWTRWRRPSWSASAGRTPGWSCNWPTPPSGRRWAMSRDRAPCSTWPRWPPCTSLSTPPRAGWLPWWSPDPGARVLESNSSQDHALFVLCSPQVCRTFTSDRYGLLGASDASWPRARQPGVSNRLEPMEVRAPVDSATTPQATTGSPRRTKRIFAVGLVAGGILLAACSSSSTPATTTTAPPGGKLTGDNATVPRLGPQGPGRGAHRGRLDLRPALLHQGLLHLHLEEPGGPGELLRRGQRHRYQRLPGRIGQLRRLRRPHVRL